MYLAKVIGSAVVTQKIPSLSGKKLLLVRQVNMDEEEIISTEKVAVDSVGAGTGELVLVAHGGAVRRIFAEPNEGIDNVIVGIVDSLSS